MQDLWIVLIRAVLWLLLPLLTQATLLICWLLIKEGMSKIQMVGP
jgi:hypothetical protein